MLKQLSERDFAVLREPLESGRQSPSSLGATLLLSIFMQSLVFFLTYNGVEKSTIFPNVEVIKKIHFWITAILVVLSIIYAIPAVYKRSQKIQYLLGILVSQNVGAILLYLSSLFSIGEGTGVTEKSLLTVAFVVLGLGILIFIATSIRFYILLNRGAYRKGTKRDKLRGNTENIIKSHFTTIIASSIGLVYIIQFMVRNSSFDLEEMLMVIIPLLVFFTMLFVLPEQLVILYCKCRFKSFNFNRRGYLESEDQYRKNDKKWDEKFVH